MARDFCALIDCPLIRPTCFIVMDIGDAFSAVVQYLVVRVTSKGRNRELSTVAVQDVVIA